MLKDDIGKWMANDRRLRESALHAFRDELPGEELVAWFRVCQKLTSLNESEGWMLFTQHRAGFGLHAGLFGKGVSKVFPREAIAGLGVGESTHDEGDGSALEYFASLTLERTDGRSDTRHLFLGTSGHTVEESLDWLRDDLRAITRAGYRVGDGPAWDSWRGGGPSFSIGYGVWTS